MVHTSDPDHLPISRRRFALGAALASAATLTGDHTAIAAAPATPTSGPGAAPAELEARRTTVRTIARWRRHGATNEGFAEFVEILARCGLPVWPQDGDSPLVSVDTPAPFGLLEVQAYSHYLGIAYGNDRSGAEIDAAIAPPDDAPPPSLILVAYARTADTPGGDFARALIGDQDVSAPANVRLHTILGLLLAADLAREDLPDAARAYRPAPASAPEVVAAQGVCSTVQTWIDKTVKAIFDAMRIDTTPDTSDVGRVLAGIWNFVVDVAQWVTRNLITQTLQQVMPLVRAIAGMLGVAGQIVGVLQPWSAAVVANPTSTRFGVDDETISGSITASIVTGAGDWPELIRDCATVAGITLPGLTASGAPITWALTEAPIDLIDSADPPKALGEDGTATVTYTTHTESGAMTTGAERTGTVDVSIVVERDDLDQLAASVQSLALANLPDIVRGYLEPIFGPIVEDVLDRLVALASVRGRSSVVVLYHDPPEPTPTPDPDTTQCILGTWTLVTMLPTFNSMIELSGGNIVYLLEEGLSQITFAADGTFIWTYTGFRLGNGQIVGMIGKAEGVVAVDGSIRGAWQLQGDRLVFPGAISIDLAMTVQAYIDDVLIMEEPLGDDLFGRFADPRGFQVTCGDRLNLLPLWLETEEPMVFARA